MNNRNRDWTADIILVLSRTSGSLTMNQLTQRLWELRKGAGKRPKAFAATVRSALNNHTSQSVEWEKNGSRPEEDLFYSPRGKYTGEWAVYRDKAAAWLEARGMVVAAAIVRGHAGGTDPVMTLAMNTARELVRQTLKQKDFNMDEWPASRISQVAKDLLDSQGEDGTIITVWRREVEAVWPLD
jgi:hypothetical protein